MLQLRSKGSDKGHVPNIRHQISSLQNDPLNNKSLFSACKMTYTPKKIGWSTPADFFQYL